MKKIKLAKGGVLLHITIPKGVMVEADEHCTIVGCTFE